MFSRQGVPILRVNMVYHEISFWVIRKMAVKRWLLWRGDWNFHVPRNPADKACRKTGQVILTCACLSILKTFDTNL